jgi:large conductance mechanosensitive channel
MSVVKEFRDFISRGNVLDLAVGVIIGAAFGKITASAVGDILTPPLGLLIGGVDFTGLKLAIGGTAEKPVTINYGSFLQTCFDFAIVAFCIFLVVKAFNAMKKKEEAAPAAPAPPSNQEVLLTEIRDLLKKK